MIPSWRFYFENKPDYDEIFYNQDEAEAYARTIPNDIAYKVVNEYAEVVYQKAGPLNPIDKSYGSGWKDVQSTIRGRKTRYSIVQQILRPSALKKTDSNSGNGQQNGGQQK